MKWEPRSLGSQKSLVPDLWLDWQSLTLTLGAKHERHGEELQRQSRVNVEQEIA